MTNADYTHARAPRPRQSPGRVGHDIGPFGQPARHEALVPLVGESVEGGQDRRHNRAPPTGPPGITVRERPQHEHRKQAVREEVKEFVPPSAGTAADGNADAWKMAAMTASTRAQRPTAPNRNHCARGSPPTMEASGLRSRSRGNQVQEPPQRKAGNDEAGHEKQEHPRLLRSRLALEHREDGRREHGKDEKEDKVAGHGQINTASLASGGTS